MAALPPPAPLAGPGVVGVTVNPAPITPQLHAYLEASSPLVLATPFLPWEAVAGGPPAQVRLPQRIMLVVFVAPCTLEDTPASLAFFQSIHVMTFALSGSAWSRILTEYVSSGLLSAPASDLSAFRATLHGLTIGTPANLIIHTPDLVVGEDFDIAGVPGVPGTAAVPRKPQTHRERNKMWLAKF